MFWTSLCAVLFTDVDLCLLNGVWPVSEHCCWPVLFDLCCWLMPVDRCLTYCMCFWAPFCNPFGDVFPWPINQHHHQTPNYSSFSYTFHINTIHKYYIIIFISSTGGRRVSTTAAKQCIGVWAKVSFGAVFLFCFPGDPNYPVLWFLSLSSFLKTLLRGFRP